MATTYIHLGKTLDGNPLQMSDIEVGTNATFPDGAGGMLICQCTERSEIQAVFESTRKDWPARWTLQEHVRDLSLQDFIELPAALGAYNRRGKPVSEAQRRLVLRARSLGYIEDPGLVEAKWTERGVEVKRSLEETFAAARCDEGLLDQLYSQICSTEDIYELRDVIGDMTGDEKCHSLQRLLTAEALS